MERYYNEKAERMPREKLRQLQSERLVELVKRVYITQPPYRAKMDAIGLRPKDIRGIEDLPKLPFTTKQDLRDNYPFGMFSAPKKDIVRLHASSGTTGKLTVVGMTSSDLDVWAEVVARGLVMAGATEDYIVQVAYGYGLFTGGLGLHYGVEKLGATVLPISSGNTQRQVMLMKDFGVNLLACTPSYAVYIAEEMEKEGVDPKSTQLKAGMFGAEPWSEEMRRQIQTRLNIKAYDIYGLSEISGPGVATQCGHSGLAHVHEDHFLPEIVDTDTLEPLPFGKRGELVFTTLTKTGMPLIRYRTRDITSLSDEPCACGRTLVRMDRVTGRSDDMLIIRGVNVFPSQIESVLMRVGKGVLPHYQILVTREGLLDKLEIRLEMDESMFSDEVRKLEEIRDRLSADLASMLSVSADVRLVEPNTIPRSEGKAKRVIDLRK